MPRSECARSRAEASSASSVKSAGPSPRTVSRASATLECVPHRAAERLVHVRQEARDLATGPDADLDHHACELTRVVDRLHERPVANLDVEDDRVGTRGELLRHDRARDQRDDVDGRRHVAERVQLLVGRDEVRRLADDCHADVSKLRDQLVRRQLDSKPGDRLELVERAAGVTETASAHLPERHAARGHDRADGDRGLVPDPAGRVLVDDLASERSPHVERLARADHRVGERVRLGRGEPVEEDSHAPGGHLVVGHVVACVGENQLRQLGRVVLAPVALLLDQLRRAHHPPPAVATKTLEARRQRSGSS